MAAPSSLPSQASPAAALTWPSPQAARVQSTSQLAVWPASSQASPAVRLVMPSPQAAEVQSSLQAADSPPSSQSSPGSVTPSPQTPPVSVSSVELVSSTASHSHGPVARAVGQADLHADVRARAGAGERLSGDARRGAPGARVGGSGRVGAGLCPSVRARIRTRGRPGVGARDRIHGVVTRATREQRQQDQEEREPWGAMHDVDWPARGRRDSPLR